MTSNPDFIEHYLMLIASETMKDRDIVTMEY